MGEFPELAAGACVKGSILLPLVQGLRANREQALELLPPELHSYLTERVILTNWYPIAPHHQLTLALGKILGGDWVMMGRALAISELTGTYRHVLRPRQPMRTLRALPGLWTLNHNTGVVTLEGTEYGADLTVVDWALALHEHVQILCGYAMQLVEMCDVSEPQARLLEHTQPPKSKVVVELRFCLPEAG